jgi:hypothetical protein
MFGGIKYKREGTDSTEEDLESYVTKLEIKQMAIWMINIPGECFRPPSALPGRVLTAPIESGNDQHYTY